MYAVAMTKCLEIIRSFDELVLVVSSCRGSVGIDRQFIIGRYDSIVARWRQFLQDPELTAIIAKANQQEELRSTEQLQLTAAFEELFTAAGASYVNSSQGKALYDSSADIIYLKNVLDANACAAAEWVRYKPIMINISPELMAAIDDHLRQSRAN